MTAPTNQASRAHDFTRKPGGVADVGACSVCGKGPLAPLHPLATPADMSARLQAADAAARLDTALTALGALRADLDHMQTPGDRALNTALVSIGGRLDQIMRTGAGQPPSGVFGILRGTVAP